MENIKIVRYPDRPMPNCAVGHVEPEDRSWILYVHQGAQPPQLFVYRDATGRPLDRGYPWADEGRAWESITEPGGRPLAYLVRDDETGNITAAHVSVRADVTRHVESKDQRDALAAAAIACNETAERLAESAGDRWTHSAHRRRLGHGDELASEGRNGARTLRQPPWGYRRDGRSEGPYHAGPRAGPRGHAKSVERERVTDDEIASILRADHLAVLPRVENSSHDQSYFARRLITEQEAARRLLKVAPRYSDRARGDQFGSVGRDRG